MKVDCESGMQLRTLPPADGTASRLRLTDRDVHFSNRHLNRMISIHSMDRTLWRLSGVTVTSHGGYNVWARIAVGNDFTVMFPFAS